MIIFFNLIFLNVPAGHGHQGFKNNKLDNAIVKSSWHSLSESSLGSYDECRMAQVAANTQTKPINQPTWAVSHRLLLSAPTVAVYYYYLVQRLITHFTVLLMV